MYIYLNSPEDHKRQQKWRPRNVIGYQGWWMSMGNTRKTSDSKAETLSKSINLFFERQRSCKLPHSQDDSGIRIIDIKTF